MNILITNDDGWGAPGIMALVEAMKPIGKVYVLAPDSARSGFSNAVTATTHVTLRRVEQADKSIEVYVTSGTPSDCVKLAINVLFRGDEKAIDLIVSGVNHGSNAAINSIYSGTIGACLVAAEHRIPAIGFSIYDNSHEADLQYFRPYLGQLTRHLLDEGIRPGICYNINAPTGQIKGIRWTRQCKSHWEKEMKETLLENGERGYLLSGYMVNDEPEATDTDEWALSHGYISIQPCSPDMTYYAAL
jgi:5'-nucleotidase